MKRWIPFILMISVALFTFVYLVFYGGTEPYKPRTDDPQLIYEQACAHCHGERGEGSGLLYPAFSDSAYILDEVKNTITEGTWLMPGFVHIKGDTLERIGRFIVDKEYLKKNK